MLGAGAPPTVHSNLTGSPAITSIFSFSGTIINGATKKYWLKLSQKNVSNFSKY